MSKIRVGILGATGMVGQQYLMLLLNHPWFEVTWLAASERSAGKLYGDVVQYRWHSSAALPSSFAAQRIHAVEDVEAAREHCELIFSAVGAENAKNLEELYASAGIKVFSNTSAHRRTPDVPLLIPEVNSHHLDILPAQQQARNWDTGFIVAKPNCSLQSYVTPLYALHKRFKVRKAIITTLQALSGAGHPGISSLDVLDNVIPYIPGEEDKSEWEPLKILGQVEAAQIVPADDIAISAHCNRVPVLDGHMACVSVQFEQKPLQEEILENWEQFTAPPQHLNLPSAPLKPLHYRHEADRPQPRLDRHTDRSMAVTIGRLRPCSVLHYRFVGLSHNTIRGAAGGGILNAELYLATKSTFYETQPSCGEVASRLSLSGNSAARR